jgi:hypothetical protein
VEDYSYRRSQEYWLMPTRQVEEATAIVLALRIMEEAHNMQASDKGFDKSTRILANDDVEMVFAA